MNLATLQARAATEQAAAQTAQQQQAAELSALLAEQARGTAREAARQAQIAGSNGDQIRQQVRDAIRGANDAVNDARTDAATDVSVNANARDGLSKTITVPDGNGGFTKITISRNGISVGAPGAMAAVPFDQIIPRGVVTMTYALCLTIVLVFVGGPLARAFARRMDRRGIEPKVPDDVMKRLAAIEHAVDAVAVEVERISEGQRFTTRLLSERTQEPAPHVHAVPLGEWVERPHG